MVEDEDAFVEAPWRQEQTDQTFFELEIRGYRLLQCDQDLRVSETEEARVLERAAQFILQKPTLNGLLSKLHTASLEMHLSWR